MAENYCQHLEMICFALVVFENKVGSLSTPRTAPVGPLFWTLTVSVRPRPLPLCLQGNMLLSRSQRRLLRLPSPSLLFLFREHRRYFYVRDLTGASQWEFPTEEDKEEDGAQTRTPGDPKAPESAAVAAGLWSDRLLIVSSFLPF